MECKEALINHQLSLLTTALSRLLLTRALGVLAATELGLPALSLGIITVLAYLLALRIRGTASD